VSTQTATAPRRVPARLAQLVAKRQDDLLVGSVPYLMLVLFVAWYAVLDPASFTGAELSASLDGALVLMFAAVGQTIVLLSGGIDLSVGGVMAVSNTIGAAYMSSTSNSIWIAIALILLGWIPGAINGLLIVEFELQPFIVTLGTWFVFDGIAFYVLPTAGGAVAPSFGNITNGSLLGIDNPIIIVVALVIAGVWFLRTRTGLEIRALGADATSAALAGVRTKRAIIVTYSISSLCAVLSGIVLSAQNLSGDPTVGDKYLLATVAAAVIGGSSLFGGAATVVGTLAGVLVLDYVSRVIFAVGLQSEWGPISNGVLLALAVAIQGIVRGRMTRKARA
jgi:ribose transport system permease protein